MAAVNVWSPEETFVNKIELLYLKDQVKENFSRPVPELSRLRAL